VSTNIDLPFNDELQQALSEKNATGELVAVQMRKDWLESIAKWIDEGKVKVPVSKVYALERAAEAHLESETWHVRGKLILEIRQEGNR